MSSATWYKTWAIYDSGKAPEGNMKKACDWIVANPHAWKWFCGEALRLAQNKRHFGSKSIFERLRYRVKYEWNKDDYKCDNSITAPLARLLIALHPDVEEYIETRKRKTP